MVRYFLRRPSKIHQWIYLVNGHEEFSEKARPQFDLTGWTYTMEELRQVNYERYDPVEEKMESKSVTNNEDIPDYVIDWVRFCKKHGKPLSYALGTTFFQNFILEKYPSSGSEYLWIRFPEHEEQLAAFWLEEKAPENE